MIPVDQTRFGGPGSPPESLGNCYAACLASILELPLDAVPAALGTTDDWWPKLQEWLHPFGLGSISLQVADGDDLGWLPRGAFHVLTGKSPRGDWDHAVVACSGRVVHDPHPSRAGLHGTARTIELFVALDPGDAAC